MEDRDLQLHNGSRVGIIGGWSGGFTVQFFPLGFS